MEQTHANSAKDAAAQAACTWLLEQQLSADSVVGIGCGSTVNSFIKRLPPERLSDCRFIAAAEASARLLRARGLRVESANAVGSIDYYFDGADEVNPRLEMIKGGGAALTGEKILASMARRFICLVDASKLVEALGAFPVPIEVIAMARSQVGRQLVALGATPEYRSGVQTEHGNVIIDAHNLRLDVPSQWERRLNDIPGVVTNGVFAQHKADSLVVGNPDGSASWRQAVG